MRKNIVHIIIIVATCLLIKMIQPYATTNTIVSQKVEMSFEMAKNVMTIPHLQNSIPTPSVHFTSLKKITNPTNNTVISKRLPINFKFFGPKTSPQSLCSFTSPNDFFVVMLRHLRI